MENASNIVGVAAVTGNFRRGDVVTIVNGQGTELGRGLAEYSSDEATRIMGCRTEHIEERLGYRGRTVMVHRFDWPREYHRHGLEPLWPLRATPGSDARCWLAPVSSTRVGLPDPVGPLVRVSMRLYLD